jgi:acyl-coenzyme A synthetase/AMP-(fatty) acid ligase
MMSLSGQICSTLARGDTLVLTYFGFMHPKFIRALDYYNVNVLLAAGFMVDKWLERTGLDAVDLSTLKIVGVSGGNISPEKMEQYRSFFKAHGYRYDITTEALLTKMMLLLGERPEQARELLGKDLCGEMTVD